MKFSELDNHLPLNTIEANPNGQLKINVNALTQDNVLTQENSSVETLGKLLQAAYTFNKELNQTRVSQGLAEINMVAKAINVSEQGNPVHVFTVMIEVSSPSSLDNVIDRTG